MRTEWALGWNERLGSNNSKSLNALSRNLNFNLKMENHEDFSSQTIRDILIVL